MRRVFIGLSLVSFVAGILVSSPGEEIEIRMVSEGFVPREVIVEQGDNVRFTNEDTRNRWPASDPHPIHDDYPAFDAERVIQPSESWTFQARQSGVWRYHDHRVPNLRGVLTVSSKRSIENVLSARFGRLVNTIHRVRWALQDFQSTFGLRPMIKEESPDDYVRSQMEICAKFGNRSPCYKEITDLFLREFKPGEVLAIFKRNEQNKEIFSRCHEVGHYVGRILYRQTKSIKDVYGQCNIMVCGVGCQHGAAEEYFREQNVSVTNDDQTIGQFVAIACGKEEDYERPILYHECLHGLGHGLLKYMDMELPRALTLCDALPSDWDKEGCYAGAFMENSTSATSLDQPSRYVRDDDPTYPCRILDEKYWKLCYQYQSSYFGEKTGWDFKKTAELCRMIPTDYQDGCLNQVATNQAMATRDPVATKATCDLLASGSARFVCIEEVVSTFGGRYIDEPEFMISFCSIVDPADQRACFMQLGATINYWGKGAEERAQVCDLIPNTQYVVWCKTPMEVNPRFL